MLKVSLNTWHNVKIISLAGELDAHDLDETVYSELAPEDRVLLDMSAVDYMTSNGIRVLLRMYRILKANVSDVMMVGLARELEETLFLTGFLEFFEVQSSLEAGLRAYGYRQNGAPTKSL